MANPFDSSDQVVGGAFTAANCILDLGTTPGGGAAGPAGAPISRAIVQRVQFSIERPINMVYEIGSSADSGIAYVYYIGGRRKGQATFERIVGGSGTFAIFTQKYGDLCGAVGDDITLKAKGGCNIAAGAPVGGGVAGPAGPSRGVTYTLKTPKIQALGGSVSAQDIVIMETATMAFLDLDYTEV